LVSKYQEKAPKAYKNSKFLNSPAARTIRILSEYLEPQDRLQRYDIRDTIVFFGSARVLPAETAKKNLTALKKKIKKYKPTSKTYQNLKKDIESAEVDLQLSRYYEDTEKLAYMLTKWSMSLKKGNKFVVCSGGGPGIMEAANKGASRAGGLSIGLNISLPFEQYPNKYITKSLNFEFHYFFMRKFWFAYLAKALVIMPGGFGTLDELMEILTLVQTEKLMKKMTILIYGSEFWKKVLNFDYLVETHMISASDLKLFKYADSPEEAFAYLKEELSKNYVKK
jgi:uncharacterized protein (TIGR00730 family)